MYLGVMAGAGNLGGWGGLIEENWRKGPWTAEEDRMLIEYVKLHGEGRWNSVSTLAGLKRNGKSCRLRWVNYLRPDLKRGQITPNEESIILELHARWGNRWSTIARSLPGRTDNEIKNYWRTHIKKKLKLSGTNSDKVKNRLLKKQQFLRQQEKQRQQQEQQLQQQQQQYQLQSQQQLQNQFDMKKIMSLFEDINETKPLYYVPQLTTTIYQNTIEDHGLVYNNTCVTAPPSSSVTEEACFNEDILWDGLWNLEDYGNFGGASITTPHRATNVHNLVAHFC